MDNIQIAKFLSAYIAIRIMQLLDFLRENAGKNL